MSRLFIVSNRLGVNISRKGKKISVKNSLGGLATGLVSFSEHKKDQKLTWAGWPGLATNDPSVKEQINSQLRPLSYIPVFLSKREIKNFYLGFCNDTIWPLFHYFLEFVDFNKKTWNTYKKINELFAKVVVKQALPSDMIWIHDYHLMLLPQLIREKIPEARIGFFLHIPFPSFEIFRLLPWRKELLAGMMGADLIGFHTYDYVRHFMSSIRRILGGENVFNQINFDNRIVKADTFPMGIDYKKFAISSSKEFVQRKIKQIKPKFQNRKVILSVDRLDYSKGIPNRLKAFNQFLIDNPEYKEKITLVLIVAPSRTNVERYMLLKIEIDKLVGKINGQHNTIGWIPIWYLFRKFDFDFLAAFYSIADVALITPLRDGMNLIAKEYIASKTNERGVLILSEMAGAANELSECILINPSNIQEISNAIKQALEMPQDEQTQRIRAMQNRIKRYTVNRWVEDFIESLNDVKTIQDEYKSQKCTEIAKEELYQDYKKSKRCLFLLDYDGTLVPFFKDPQQAAPDRELQSLLKDLSRDEKNEIVIISGRRIETLNQWFKDLNINLVGEHGLWIKEKNNEPEPFETLTDEWKEQIRPILERFVDRTPGAFIEEKFYSLVWHYRKSDPELGPLRTRELKEALIGVIANMDLTIMKGNKVLEIKSTRVNKGITTQYFLEKGNWDYVIGIGDDWTDEDIFVALPDKAYSITVGMKSSHARYYVDNPSDVRNLLKKIAQL